MNRPVNDVRLFFALWPNQAVRKSIGEALSSCDLAESRLVPESNFHLTLHFIGNVSFSDMECLLLNANKVKTASFSLSLDHCNGFAKPKVVWIGCSDVPIALLTLQSRLGKALNPCGFVPEKRPFMPHVTVARKVVKIIESPIPEAIHWTINRFVLVKSISIEGGVEYQVVDSFYLD